MRKLFWKMVTKRFLLTELRDHNELLNYHVLSERDRAQITSLLNEYVIPEIKRRGLEHEA